MTDLELIRWLQAVAATCTSQHYQEWGTNLRLAAERLNERQATK